MLLQATTKRTIKTISETTRLHSHSALSLTLELQDRNIDGKAYHVTMTKLDLLDYLRILEKREAEIKAICESYKGQTA